MDHHHHHRSTTAFTIFTFLLFAGGATARISFDLSPATADLPPVLQTSNDASSNTGDSNSNIVLPREITKSESNDVMNHESEIEKEKEKDRMFRVDLTPRMDFARFHAINRHFFDKPRAPIRSDSDSDSEHRRSHHHFMNPFVIPRSKISHENDDDVILSGEKTGNVNVEIFHRRAPAKKTAKVKHDNGHRHHRHHRHNNHNHLHLHHGNNGGSVSKHVFDREKVKSMVHKHKEEKRVHESGFIKRIRKFLEHTFD